MTLQDALCKYQHVAADRVYLVQTNCSKFLELHEDFSEKFTNTSAKFKTCVQSIDVQNEVNKFVQITTANSKQVIIYSKHLVTMNETNIECPSTYH